MFTLCPSLVLVIFCRDTDVSSHPVVVHTAARNPSPTLVKTTTTSFRYKCVWVCVCVCVRVCVCVCVLAGVCVIPFLIVVHRPITGPALEL